MKAFFLHTLFSVPNECRQKRANTSSFLTNTTSSVVRKVNKAKLTTVNTRMIVKPPTKTTGANVKKTNTTNRITRKPATTTTMTIKSNPYQQPTTNKGLSLTTINTRMNVNPPTKTTGANVESQIQLIDSL